MRATAVAVLMSLGIAASLVTEAAPYQFEATVEAKADLADPIIELEIQTWGLRDQLKVRLAQGELHAEVTNLETGQPAPSVTSVRDDSRALILWAIPGEVKAGASRQFKVVLHEGAAPAPAPLPPGPPLTVDRDAERIMVATGLARITHEMSSGGMISRIEYGDAPHRALPISMNDRLYDRESGGFYLRQDGEPKVSVTLIPGWRARMEVESKYVRGGRWPESEPRARYRFTYRAGSPFVEVSGRFHQEAAPRSWPELHFLEILHTQDFFTHWVRGAPLDSGPLDHPGKTTGLKGKKWGAVLTENDALGLTDTNLYGIHDGLGKYGIYVHGPWLSNVSGPARFKARVYVGPSGGSPEVLAALIERPWPAYSLTLRFPEAEKGIEAAAQRLAEIEKRVADHPELKLDRWLKAARLLLADARRAASAGDLDTWAGAVTGSDSMMGTMEDAIRDGKAPRTPIGEIAGKEMMFFAGDLCFRARQDEDRNVRITQLADLVSGENFVTGRAPAPLWAARFRHRETSQIVELRAGAASGWGVRYESEQGEASMSWEQRSLPGEAGVVDVEMTIRYRPDSSLTRWRINIKNRSEQWGLWEVDFPRIEGIAGGEGSALVVPRKWGTEYRNPAAGGGFTSQYPSAWMNMQLFSYALGDTGLYLAAHDPAARIKTFSMKPDGEGGLNFALTNFPDDMGKPGQDYEMPFDAAVGVHPGGWYEAAKTYRQWVTKNAPWCSGGPLATREDVPQWFKDCALCFRPGGGAPGSVMPTLRNLHAALQMPAVVHWYTWHQIPFDNDYPEYFPTKPGFREAVAEAQKLGLRIMPYINGRLWDSDTKSWAEERADKAVARKADGEPYWEHWSKQNHGVMCPLTELWQSKMRDTASRLADEYGCAGVYLDQIGAARGNLCFAENHGHDIGGAASWVAGEQKLLAGVREAARAVNPDFIMTTEDNAEPYMAQLDGYLMCNAVGPDMVPLYAAVYGGYTLTFGRSGQLNNDDAFAMQHGQAFVFGSMMGRLNSDDITKPEHAKNLDFLKRLAKMRYEFREFLALGEMLRAPDIGDEIPILETQFSTKSRGTVRMAAVQSAAWRAPDGRLGLFFVNISSEVQSIALDLDAEQYGIAGKTLEVVAVPDDGEAPAAVSKPSSFREKMSIRPWHAQALIIRGRE